MDINQGKEAYSILVNQSALYRAAKDHGFQNVFLVGTDQISSAEISRIRSSYLSVVVAFFDQDGFAFSKKVMQQLDHAHIPFISWVLSAETDASGGRPKTVEDMAASFPDKDTIEASLKNVCLNKKGSRSQQRPADQRRKFWYWFFTFIAVLLFAGRIIATRILSDRGELFDIQQYALIRRVLYFGALLVIFRVLLYRSSKRRFILAFLMLIPLVLDASYLIPRNLYTSSSILLILADDRAGLLLKCMLLAMALFAKPEYSKKFSRTQLKRS